MNLTTVLIVVLGLSCAAAGGHEKRKWRQWKDGDEDCDEPESKYAESEDWDVPFRAGSVPGTPGVDFPDFKDIPNTKFSCADHNYVPGFYADLETNCQVFHVCYENRRESFLCPVGTIFSEPLKTCDYWYSAECRTSPKPQKKAPYVPLEIKDKEYEMADPIIEELMNVMWERETGDELSGGMGYGSEGQSAGYQKPTDPPTEVMWDSKQQKHSKASGLKSDSLPDEIMGYFPTGKREEKPSKSEGPSKTSDKASTLTDAGEFASVIIKSLLPIKSKVVDLIAERTKKTKSEKETKSEEKQEKIQTTTPIPTTVTEAQRPQTSQRPVFSPPKAKMIPKVRARVNIPWGAAPIVHQPTGQSFSYLPGKPSAKTGSPISLLTKKQLALNYAKLWKLKQLKSPLLGLLKSM